MNEEKAGKIKEMMKILSDANNSSSAEAERIAEIMAEEFLRDHRTLQQGMTRTFYHFFKKVAEYSNWNDARNAASMRWIKKVSDIEGYFPFI